ncbi:MAG: hypothetical protein M3548_08605 [Actinomycetota bacterium]|nr:hypothetical protein [Actinomycetota bacterium]
MTDGPDRAGFREFVRRAHPDRGGDHDEFVAGLAARRPAPREDSRYDAPVVGVPGVRGMGRVVRGLRRWRERRSRPPRVE